jgi:molybdate transport system ATP-binding protein
VSIVIRDLLLDLPHHQLEVTVEMRARTTALYGPSGSGKTSLLEAIAGLRTPASGRIELMDRTVFDSRGVFVQPRDRGVGYVPQDDALFPHLSVRRNIFYGAPEHADASHVIEVLEIAPLLDRGVTHLSGGERKRVALARALLSRPNVLLLDEPLAGVDLELRTRVLAYLLRVRDEFPIPMIYVTHQREEVEAICEEIVVIKRTGYTNDAARYAVDGTSRWLSGSA